MWSPRTELNGSSVVVTGVGVASGQAESAAALWALLEAGEAQETSLHTATGVRVLPAFIDAGEFGRTERRRTARSAQLAVVAARRAVSDGKPGAVGEGGGVVMATASNGAESLTEETRRFDADPRSVHPFLSCRATGSQRATAVSMDLGWTGPAFAPATACAAGNDALGLGMMLVASGTCEVVLVGGSEAPLSDPWIRSMDALGVVAEDGRGQPFDAGRHGFVMAEGAAAVLLESAERAAARGARIYGSVEGYSATCDAFNLASPDSSGVQAERSINSALRSAGVSAEEVSLYCAHASATRANDAVEAEVARRVFGSVPVLATKGLTGHPFGASAVFEAILALESLRRGVVPAPIGLVDPMEGALELGLRTEPVRLAGDVAVSTAFGLGGVNATVVLRGVS
jgi:3-oxoacyl-[acyl-carrier-protein] synthase II